MAGNINVLSVYAELATLSLEELITRFNGPNLGEELVYYDEVAHRIREKGEAGNTFLLKALKEINNDDGERLRAVLSALNAIYGVQPLTRHYRYWFRDQLLFYLQDTRPLILNQAVHGLWRLRAKKAVDRIFGLRHHESVPVRESVLRYLSDLYPERAYPVLLEALKDQDWMVRSEAADQLGLFRKAEAMPHLRLLLNDTDTIVRESAENAIRILEFDLSLTNA